MDEVVVRVTVVIVTYNSSSDIDGCISPLLAPSSGLDIEIIVVDNASSDATLDHLQGYCTDGHVTVVASPINLGFARGVNSALSRISATDRPVLLLNPDARIEPNELSRLLNKAAGDSSIGVISPLVTQEVSTMSVGQAGYSPTLRHMFIQQCGLGRFHNRVKFLKGHYIYPRDASAGILEVDWVAGGCLLMTPAARRNSPRLDETWFMYAEDIEYCLRIKRDGLRVVVDTSTHAGHEVGGSNRSKEPSSLWLQNLYFLYERDLSPNRAASLCWRATLYAGLSARAVIWACRSRVPGTRPSDRQDRRRSKAFFGYAKSIVNPRRE